jgi:hypothetical protein
MTPSSTNRQSAIASFRARATMPTLRPRMPLSPNRSCHHSDSWLFGWYRSQNQASSTKVCRASLTRLADTAITRDIPAVVGTGGEPHERCDVASRFERAVIDLGDEHGGRCSSHSKSVADHQDGGIVVGTKGRGAAVRLETGAGSSLAAGCQSYSFEISALLSDEKLRWGRPEDWCWLVYEDHDHA